MSSFQPGMANSTTPMFEPDTSIVTVTPTLLSFPDVIPAEPSSLIYTVVPVSTDPVSYSKLNTYIVSCRVSITASSIGNGKGVIQFRLGGLDGINSRDFIIQCPTGPWINTGVTGYLFTFTGLVSTLPTNPLKLYIFKFDNGDTTTYSIDAITANYKVL